MANTSFTRNYPLKYEIYFTDLDDSDDAKQAPFSKVEPGYAQKEYTSFMYRYLINDQEVEITKPNKLGTNTKPQKIRVQFEDARYSALRISGWSHTKVRDPKIAKYLEIDPNRSFIDSYVFKVNTIKNLINSREIISPRLDPYGSKLKLNQVLSLAPFHNLYQYLSEWYLVSQGKELAQDLLITYDAGELHLLLELISKAKQTICLCSFVLTSAEIEAALIQAAERGVKIYMLIAFENNAALVDSDDLFDQKVYNRYVEVAYNLRKKGVIIHTMQHCHAKFLIVDHTNLNECQVVVSTANFTDEGFYKNVEKFEHLDYHGSKARVLTIIEVFKRGFFEQAQHILECSKQADGKKCITLRPFNPQDYGYTESNKITSLEQTPNNSYPQGNTTLDNYLKLFREYSTPPLSIEINSYSFDNYFKLDQYLEKDLRLPVCLSINANKTRFNLPYFINLLQSEYFQDPLTNVHIAASSRWHKKSIAVLEQAHQFVDEGEYDVASGSSNFTKQGLATGFELNIRYSDPDYNPDKAKFKFNYQIPLCHLYDYYKILPSQVAIDKFIQLINYNPQTNNWEETEQTVQLSDRALVLTKYRTHLPESYAEEHLNWDRDFISSDQDYSVNLNLPDTDYVEDILEQLTSTQVEISNPHLDFSQIDTGNLSPELTPLIDYCSQFKELPLVTNNPSANNNDRDSDGKEINGKETNSKETNSKETINDLSSNTQTTKPLEQSTTQTEYFAGLPTNIYYETEISIPGLPDNISRDVEEQAKLLDQALPNLEDNFHNFYQKVLTDLIVAYREQKVGFNLPAIKLHRTLFTLDLDTKDNEYDILCEEVGHQYRGNTFCLYLSNDCKKLYISVNVEEAELNSNVFSSYIDMAHRLKQAIIKSDYLNDIEPQNMFIVVNFGGVDESSNFTLKMPTYQNTQVTYNRSHASSSFFCSLYTHYRYYLDRTYYLNTEPVTVLSDFINNTNLRECITKYRAFANIFLLDNNLYTTMRLAERFAQGELPGIEKLTVYKNSYGDFYDFPSICTPDQIRLSSFLKKQRNTFVKKMWKVGRDLDDLLETLNEPEQKLGDDFYCVESGGPLFKYIFDYMFLIIGITHQKPKLELYPVLGRDSLTAEQLEIYDSRVKSEKEEYHSIINNVKSISLSDLDEDEAED